MGNQVFEEKACYTLFSELLAHPKAQDISHLYQKHTFFVVHRCSREREKQNNLGAASEAVGQNGPVLFCQLQEGKLNDQCI